jgi:hypothetical protein
MTLTELFDTLMQQNALPPSRVKDIKTSLRYLARAMDTTPDLLPDAETLGPHYQAAVRSHLTQMKPPPSHHTIRNTMNNLSFFFRTTRALGLLQAFIPLPTRRKITQELRQEAHQSSPYAKRASAPRRPYAQPPSAWPKCILKKWKSYTSTRQFELRSESLRTYQTNLRRYVSYLLTVEEPPITRWSQIFDPKRLQRFVEWHAARQSLARTSRSGRNIVDLVLMLARHEARPELPALQTLSRKLPTPEPMHDKQRPEHSITLQELENVGLTLLTEVRQSPAELTPPKRSFRHSSSLGTRLASNHGKALILRLLVRVPLRQRNIRELQLGHNLYRDHQGIWQLHFQGEDLQIGERGGRTNTFHMPFPPDLVEHLDEYLERYRPLLLRREQPTTVFLNSYGRPYQMHSLLNALFLQVYARIGKRFYPHLIRTIWTDAFLLKTHDVSTAAYMLNDRPETVLKRYHELRGNDHIQKAYQFTQSLLGTS